MTLDIAPIRLEVVQLTKLNAERPRELLHLRQKPEQEIICPRDYACAVVRPFDRPHAATRFPWRLYPGPKSAKGKGRGIKDYPLPAHTGDRSRCRGRPVGVRDGATHARCS